MITCKECKFYQPPQEKIDEWDLKDSVFNFNGKCNCPKFIDVSKQQDIWDEDNPPKLNDELCFSDYDYYEVRFWVGPNFGCIHGVKK